MSDAISSPSSVTPEEAAAFFTTNGDLVARSILRIGDNLAIQAGQQRLSVSTEHLEQLLQDGAIAGDTNLIRSCLVYEAAMNAYLKQSAARSILQAFSEAVESGRASAAALQEAYYNIVLAYEVEAYVNNKNGLATDIRRVSTFAEEALESVRQSQGHEPSAERAAAIMAHQHTLDQALNEFMDAVAEAQNGGSYTRAYDAQQQFFQVTAAVIETDYWRQRAQIRNRDLALAETAGAIARSRTKLSHLAEAIAERQRLHQA